MTLATYLETACSAGREAGRLLAEKSSEWNKVTAETAKDIKLQADVEAERVILAQLGNGTELPIFTEESGWHGFTPDDGPTPGGLYWVVDPLDGTANYHRDFPLCCVSIALVDGITPVAGVIYDFNRDELFAGAQGLGATLNGAPIQVSTIDQAANGVVVTGFPIRSDFSPDALAAFATEMARWRKVRMIGSAALALAYVAAGRADTYHEENTMFWDVAAGCALITAAGGKVEITGPAPEKPLSVIATNGLIGNAPHQQAET